MGMFRKKPIVIEAYQLPTAGVIDGETDVTIALWCDGRWTDKGLVIETLEGDMLAGPGDWIIKGVNGEFYPCKADIFDKTYDRVGS